MIESVIGQIIQTRSPADLSKEYLGFLIDADVFLGRAKWVTQHKVVSQENPTCMVVIEATLAGDVDTLQSVLWHLKELWNVISYRSFEASSVEWYRTATILRFVTVTRKDCHYVTGRLRVSGGPYAKLAESFLQRFGDLGEEPGVEA